MLRIGIDAMGGDYAPDVIIEGAVMAHEESGRECKLVLFGDSGRIRQLVSAKGLPDNTFEIVHTTEVITMEDHAAKAYGQKADSSISVGFRHLKDHRIDGFASAGSTGAMLVGAVYSAETIRNIIRPAISALVATTNGGKMLLLDVGLNVDCKPDVLDQYGVIGSVYAKSVLGIDSPRIALLNIGEEKEKGNLATKAAYDLLVENERINFVGNIEANEIFTGAKADVVVCDGFVGNTILKQTEGFYEIAKERGIKDSYIDKLNYEFVGGTAVLGINSVVVIGHGRSSALAVKNMILQTMATVKAGLVHKLQDIFSNF
jgi:glycerol-3-phosphate acyltransferase PlsX